MAEPASGRREIKLALVGFLVLLAFSLATAWGRKPPKEDEVKVTMRRISASEVMDILGRFPGMVPKYMASARNDTSYMTSVFQFSDVTAVPLRQVFPNARFYKGLDFSISPPYPYLMAIAGDKRYIMLGRFNRLLFDSGLKVIDKNIIELAKAFVLLAVGSEPVFVRMDMPLGLDTFPPVTFLEGKRMKQEISRITYDAKLKVRIGEQMEEWYFASWHGQLGVVSRGNVKGLIEQYDLPDAGAFPQR